MPKSLKVRSLSPDEQTALEAGRQSSDGFTVRRSQIILASAAGQKPPDIAEFVGGTRQNVCLVIHEFEERGLACLVPRPSGPKPGDELLFDVTKRERLKTIAHTSPREYGQARSVWTLKSLAQVCHEQALVDTPVSHETKCGGPDWPTPICMPGARLTHSNYIKSTSRKPILIPKPLPVMVCGAQSWPSW